MKFRTLIKVVLVGACVAGLVLYAKEKTEDISDSIDKDDKDEQ